MAKPQQKLQQNQHHRLLKDYFICSTSVSLCGVTILLLCGIASGNENIPNAEGNHNYTTTSTFPQEQRLRRDIPTTETEVRQVTVVAHSGTGEPDDVLEKSIHLSQTNDLERNLNPYKELNIFKRAPNGFIGMRGKKESDDIDYYSSNAIDWNPDPLFHRSTVEDYDEDAAYAENERYKKAPTAFYGVRGKKMPNHNGNGHNPLNDMLQQLEEERLRERMLQDFIGRLAVAAAAENEINKRAPTGFTGLRGKRPNWDSENELESYEKRAPVNAFLGVRGKKDMTNQQEMHQTLFKRSPSESFNGKRRFADFNNKFVAVRGKKDVRTQDINADADTTEEERESRAQFVERQRLRYLVNMLPSLVDGTRNVKRAPIGFTGMRGKRAAVTSTDTAKDTVGTTA